MSRLKQLIHEVHRRSLWQVLGIYVAVSWVVFQVVQTLTEGLGLPDWVPPLAFVLLLIGLPIVMATAFVQEGIPVAGGSEEVSSESESVADAVEDQATAPRAVGVRRLFTWRKAILGGVLAFTLLGIGTAAYTVMRVLGIGPVGSLVAAGALEEGERTVLADFESQTGDSLLAAAVTEAFRIDIAQSQLITIVQPSQINRVLRRMGREPSERLDLELAREVAIREGYKAVISGEINAAGAGYVLSAQLIAPESGDELAAFRVTASDSTTVIGAIDKLSKKMRERIGESLKTIRANEPLETVTTASLEALRLYSRGRQALEVDGDVETGVALLEEAVALDSTFAMAWRKLGIALGRRGGEFARELAAFEKAVELRDRLTDRERYTALGTYYSAVDDRERAIAAYRSLLDLYPDDVTGLNNLSLLYSVQRDYERALELRRRALTLEPTNWLFYSNLAHSEVAVGDWAAAESTIDSLAAALPGHPRIEALRVFLGYARGDYDASESHVLALREAERGSAVWQARTSNYLAIITQTRGQLAAAERHRRDEAATNEQRGFAAARRDQAFNSAWFDLWFRGDTVSALRKVDEALERYPLEMRAPLDRPYLETAWFFAFAGEPERAREYLAAWEAEIDPLIQRGLDFRHGVRGVIALAEGRFEDALEGMRAWDQRVCAVCALSEVAYTYDRAGVPDSALAAYERFITTPWLARGGGDSWWLGWSFERLGALYEERGNTERAIYYYGKLVELWKDADPELQPRVEAARRAISVLSPDQ